MAVSASTRVSFVRLRVVKSLLIGISAATLVAGVGVGSTPAQAQQLLQFPTRPNRPPTSLSRPDSAGARPSVEIAIVTPSRRITLPRYADA